MPPGDSGELIAVARSWGIAHAPGYPLYTILAHFFSLLPIGNIAWRVNLLSAVCDALATGIFFLLVRDLTKNNWAALASSSLFAFSPLVWNYATQAEVFGLNNLFVLLTWYLSFRLYIAGRKAQARNFYWLCFVIGLGLTNQQTFLFAAAPALALALGWPKALNQEKGNLVRGVICLLGGMLPLLYLPLAASRHPAIMWGDPSSWSGFLWHVLRRDYGTFQLLANETNDSGLGSRIWLYLQDLGDETLYVGGVLALVGLGFSLKRKNPHRTAGIWLAVMFVGYFGVFNVLAKFPLGYVGAFEMLQRFWQQANIPVFIWIGIGLSSLVAKLKPRGVMLASALLGLTQVGIHYRESDQSGNWTFQQYGKKLVESLPQNAVLLADFEYAIYPIYYLQACEGIRTDVKMVLQGSLTAPWIRSQLQWHYPDLIVPSPVPPFQREKEKAPISMTGLISANYQRVPLFLVPRLQYVSENELKEASWETRPYGLATQIVGKQDPWNLLTWMQATEESSHFPIFSGSEQYMANTWEHHLWGLNWHSAYHRSEILLGAAFKDRSEKSFLRGAIQGLDSLNDSRFELPADFFKNLGVAHQLAATPQDEKIALAAFKKFLAIGPTDDPQRAKMELFVRTATLN